MLVTAGVLPLTWLYITGYSGYSNSLWKTSSPLRLTHKLLSWQQINGNFTHCNIAAIIIINIIFLCRIGSELAEFCALCILTWQALWPLTCHSCLLFQLDTYFKIFWNPWKYIVPVSGGGENKGVDYYYNYYNYINYYYNY